MASPQDSVLSVLADSEEILYRIRRSDKRIVYVTVLDPDIIPKNKRTYGPSAIEELGKLNAWKDPWITLTVDSDNHGVVCQEDINEPHAVPRESLLDNYPRCEL